MFALDLGTISTNVSADASGLFKTMRGVEQAVTRSTRQVEGMMNRMSRSVSGSVNKMSAGVSSGMLRATAAIGGTVLAMKALRTAADLLTQSISLAAEAESTSVAFEVLIGSASKAEKVLKGLRTFAETTPFEFPELADAGRKLIAFGTASEDVTAELRMIGDISSGIQAPIGEIASIFGKARTSGRLFMEDLNQLTGRGIPMIGQLARQFGVAESAVRKLVESGQVNFAHLERAFQDLTSEGGQFAGMMERQSQTVLGQWSTFKDDMGVILREVGETILEEIDTKQLLADVKSITKVIADDLTPAIRSAAEAVGGITEGFADLRQNFNELKAVLDLINTPDNLSEGMASVIPQGVHDFAKGIDESAFGKGFESLTGMPLIGLPERAPVPDMEEVMPGKTPREMDRMAHKRSDEFLLGGVMSAVKAPEAGLNIIADHIETFAGKVADAAPKIEKFMDDAREALTKDFAKFETSMRTPADIFRQEMERLESFKKAGMFEGKEDLLERAVGGIEEQFAEGIRRDIETEEPAPIKFAGSFERGSGGAASAIAAAIGSSKSLEDKLLKEAQTAQKIREAQLAELRKLNQNRPDDDKPEGLR